MWYFYTMIAEIKNSLLSLAYPPLCPLCGAKARDRRVLCEGCFSSIKKNPPPYCAKCGRSLKGAVENVETCWECGNKNFYYERSWSAFLYEGPVREALHLLKYSGKLWAGELFSCLLINFLKENTHILRDIDCMAAVPLYGVKLREREFNQARIFSGAICRGFGIKDAGSGIKRRVYTRPQSELDKDQRQANVAGTFSVCTPGLYASKNVLLVDDIFTTGATLNECARVLKGAGAETVHCLTLARGA